MAIVGREAGADIILPFPQVSARHAHIQRLGPSQYRVRDLGSANGTFVNSKPVHEATVTPKDEVRFGSLIFDWTRYLPVLEREGGDSRGVTVGRDPSNRIVIADQRVSSRHATVVVDGDRLLLSDCGSVNGTFVNGRKVQEAAVGRGDQVRFGSLPVDLFGLLAASGLGPQLPIQVDGSSAKPPVGPPPRPPISGSGPTGNPRRLSTAAIVAITVAAVVVIGVALVFLTSQTIAKNCEACGREIFRKQAYLWNRNEIEAEANRLRFCERCAAPIVVTKNCEVCGKEILRREGEEWQRAQFEAEAKPLRFCEKCGSELVPVTYVIQCVFCKSKYKEYVEMVPRREVVQAHIEKEEGYCSDRCRLQDEAEKFGRGAKDVLTHAGEGLSKMLQDVQHH